MGVIGRDFVFVHVTKTAGTSLTNALVAAGGTATPDCTELVEFCRPRTSITSPKHYHARHFIQYFGETEWRRRFTFGFVRNPWDRLVSRYEYIRMTPEHGQHARVCGRSFKQFARRVAGNSPCSSWFEDETGKQLVDQVYRFEDLVEAYPEIMRRAQLSGKIELPRLNTSPREPYRNYYDDELAELVAQCSADDITRYGYSF